MIEFLQSVKSDLFSRRLLPFAVLLAVGLLAAAGYAATGGSNATPAPSAGASGPQRSATKTLPVAVAPANPNEAVSETPGGGRFQNQGPTRDPFVPLPAPPEKNTTSSTASNASTAPNAPSTGGASSGPSGGSGGSKGRETPAPTPKKPAKPTFPYIVSVLFGRASTIPGQPATLAPYENIKLLQPLPSKEDRLMSFERVTAAGDGAVFKLVVPPILRGSGICLPSTSECQAIDLQVGHTEELEYTEANGQAVVYEMKVVSITKKRRGASATRLKRTAKQAQARFKVAPEQSIGVASAFVYSPGSSASSTPRR